MWFYYPDSLFFFYCFAKISRDHHREGMQPEVQYEQDNQEQPKKRTRTTNKCGACVGGSRPCGPACAYRKLFPDGRFKVAADMIIKFFKKDPLVELVESCTDDQISKLRDNLFFYLQLSLQRSCANSAGWQCWTEKDTNSVHGFTGEGIKKIKKFISFSYNIIAVTCYFLCIAACWQIAWRTSCWRRVVIFKPSQSYVDLCLLSFRCSNCVYICFRFCWVSLNLFNEFLVNELLVKFSSSNI